MSQEIWKPKTLWDHLGVTPEPEEQPPTIEDLLQRVVLLAQDHKGHLTIIRTEAGWKCCFGVPQTQGEFLALVECTKAYPTIREALEDQLREPRIFGFLTS